jgi:hypothetical protein
MRWWRLRRRAGATLGLLALAAQLVLSFGHIHPQDIVARSTFGSDAAGLQVSDARISSAPSNHQVPSRLPDSDCPICLAMHVSASGLLPAAPLVVVPLALGWVSQGAIIEEFDISTPRHVLFQTRAPPLA